MRRVLAIAGALVLTSSMCYAQDAPDMKPGTKALLFTFNGPSVLSAGNFDGGAGFKYFIADGVARDRDLGSENARYVDVARPFIGTISEMRILEGAQAD